MHIPYYACEYVAEYITTWEIQACVIQNLHIKFSMLYQQHTGTYVKIKEYYKYKQFQGRDGYLVQPLKCWM